MSRTTNVIDLPVSPLRSTVAEGNLLNAPVSATLMNGKTVTGRLAGLDGPQAIVTLHSSEKGRSLIRFSDLRHLNFISKSPTNTGKHPLEHHVADVSMPKAVEDFQVIFTDGRTLSGRTRGSFVDDTGLHFFQLVGSAYISRLFIPAQVVKKYHIGDRKPATPQRHAKPIQQSTPDQGREHKPAMQRRKTDKQTSGMTLNTLQLEQAFTQQPGPAHNGLLAAKQIGHMLVEENTITPEQLEAALKTQQGDPTRKLGEILATMGTVSAHEIYRTLAHKFGLPFVLLRNFYIDLECMHLVPADVARKYTLIPLVLYQKRLVVAMDDPANTEAITLLRFITRYSIEPAIAMKEDINWAIGKYYGPSPTNQERTVKLQAGTHEVIPFPSPGSAPEAGIPHTDKPIASFVDNTLLDAIQRDAMDILFQPNKDYVELLFRINGAVIPIRRFSKVLYPKVIDRIKSMSGMHPGVDRVPQHGQTSLVCNDAVVDLRITTASTADGEAVMLHILHTDIRAQTIEELAMHPRDEQLFREALNKTYTVVPVSGPEGSDKTATLYAALHALIRQNLSILTVEDPISYHMSGADQIQLDHHAGNTYAKILHAMDLKNTDVVMIGEIHDQETAKAAIETALSEHLVLSKLHAHNAADALTRLAKMGIKPQTLKSALPCILAQRALRRNCSHCLAPEEPGSEIRKALGAGADEAFYRGTGCDRCTNTGYHGRVIVYELMQMTPEIFALLENGASADELQQQAIKDGMIPLMEHALKQARARRVALTEVSRHR